MPATFRCIRNLTCKAAIVDELIETLDVLLENIVEDVPHDRRTPHLQEAIDDAFAVSGKAKRG